MDEPEERNGDAGFSTSGADTASFEAFDSSRIV
jgi:hypothetical protein